MKTACLRIKFTPLLQNIQNEDSKHCVEIVPEISYIQNLDKIEWSKKENSIEYTIPMTYKIILRKKHVTKDKQEELDNTYHSCVDLLLQSSDNFMPLGSGDVSRIVSDTLVLGKVTTHVKNYSILLKDDNLENKKYESTETIKTQVQTEQNSNFHFTDQLVHNDNIEIIKSRETASTQTSSEVTQTESHVIQVPNADIVDFVKKSIDKITNTDTSEIGVKATSLEEVVEVSTSNSRSETKHNLSLTPICSINTDDDQTDSEKRIASNTVMFLRYETQKEFAKVVRNTVKCDDLYFSMYNGDHNSRLKASMPYHCVTNYKVQPEVRVANFVQIMEKEIMPLKLMLSDIITKCSSLGFSWQKPKQHHLLYRNVLYNEKQMSRCLKTKKQTNSNRVVYSIVFDG